jgi:hypothetical protein
MDDRSKERLDELLLKEPKTLTDIQIAFLKARRSYLSESQEEKLSSIFNQTSKRETVKKNAKKSRKTK